MSKETLEEKLQQIIDSKNSVKDLKSYISEVVVDELYKYQQYLIEEQKTNVKQIDLENYLEI